MTSRFKVLIGCLSAVMALSAIGVGVAQAARPVQPQFQRNGVTIGEGFKVEASSQRSRLWASTAGTVIRCEKDEATGTIGDSGLDNAEVTYKECKLFTAVENTQKQFEEGEEIAGCVVGEAGSITTKPIRTHLVWLEGGSEVYDLYLPNEGTTFVEISFGASCGVFKNLKLPVTGSVLGRVPRINQEAIAGVQLFEVLNENGKVLQHATKWEVEQRRSGKVEKGTAELKLGEKVAALEGIEQIELVRVGNKRGLLGVTE